MSEHRVGTREEWLAARLELLEAEKKLTRRSDELARRAGLSPPSSGEVEVPFEVPDQTRLGRAFRVMHAERIGATGDAARRTILGTTEPFRRPDGSYSFMNRFRYVVAEA